jgi:serine/threonine-protein kinase
MIYLVLEYQPKGTLMNTLQSQATIAENDVRMIMEQILLTLDLFKNKKIVHRDIKLDNILIKSIDE